MIELEVHFFRLYFSRNIVVVLRIVFEIALNILHPTHHVIIYLRRLESCKISWDQMCCNVGCVWSKLSFIFITLFIFYSLFKDSFHSA
jgi:hypothetical protein